MENMFIWMLIFAGATIGLLGTFLAASERELKNKRRELNEMEAKLGNQQTADEGDPTPEPEHANTDTTPDLVMENRNLTEQVALLSTSLDESQNTIAELRAAQNRSADTQSENQYFATANRQLQEEITNLRDKLQAKDIQPRETDDQDREVADRLSQLQTESNELKKQLEESEAKNRQLELTQQQLNEAQSQEEAWRDQQHRFESEIAQLKKDLVTEQEKMRATEVMETRFKEMEYAEQNLREENQRLQAEVSRYQQHITEMEQKQMRFEKLRHHLEELQSNQASLTERHRQFQENLMSVTRLLDTTPMNANDFASAHEYSTTGNSNAEPNGQDATMMTSVQDEPSLQLVKEQIYERSYHGAITNLNELLNVDPKNRETKLYHLLASIHLNGICGYEKEIDSIKDMSDLTEGERSAARDIFLFRADEAQKSGRDDEMLRYRAWARNVIYRTPFGTSDTDATTPIVKSNGGSENQTNGQNVASAKALTQPAGPEPSAKPARKSKRRFTVFIVFVVLALAGAMTLSYFTTVAQERATAERSGATTEKQSLKLRNSSSARPA